MGDDDSDFQQRLLETYRMEAAEHLEEMTDSLISLADTRFSDREGALEKLYRATHSLKGAARAVGEASVELGCQSFETVIAGVRSSGRALATDEIEAMERAVAIVERLTQHDEETFEYDVAEALEPLSRERSPEDATPPAVSTPATDPPPKRADAPDGPRAVEPAREEPNAPDTVRIRVDRLEHLMASSEELRTIVQANDRLADRVASIIAADRTRDRHDPGGAVIAEIGEEALRTARAASEIVNAHLNELRDVMIVPLQVLLRTYQIAARKLAQEQGKRVDVEVDDGGVEIDKRVVDSIRDALMHVVRNGVDHGVELPDDRVAAGKRETATIRFVATQREPGTVTLAISDDGSGVDLDALRARTGAHDLDDADLLRKVFDPDVSTRTRVSLVSGRGMGMTIARESVERIGGTVEIASTRGKGTVLTFQLPTHFARYRGLLLIAGDRRFFVPSASVQQVVLRKDSRVRSVQNALSFVAEERVVKIVRLSDLLEIDRPDMPGPEEDQGRVVLVRAGEKRIAVLVDDISGEMEIVVRSLGPHLAGLRHVTGAAVLADGEIVPVLNPHDLVVSAAALHGVTVVETSDVSAPRSVPRVLVVEDSVTSRMLLRSILDSAGYLTSVAKDGAEAWQLLAEEPFDLVVSDIDMPRMNGFVLSQKIRQSVELKNLPVILLTALASEDDRKRGLEAGADAYLTKGGFDQAALIHTIERLV